MSLALDARGRTFYGSEFLCSIQKCLGHLAGPIRAYWLIGVAALRHPKNTLAAIALGKARGFMGIEIDAVLARDEVAVLMHDATLTRTTNGRGSVRAYTAAQLALLDAGAWHSPAFVGTPVPTLRQTLEFCRAQSIWVNIEIKPIHGFAALTGLRVAQTVRSVFARDDTAADFDPRLPLLSSFSVDALAAAANAAPDYARALLVNALPNDWAAQARRLGCVAVHCNQRHLTQPQAKKIKRAGYGLLCYTVNDPVDARRLLDWGVDAYCTDDMNGASD